MKRPATKTLIVGHPIVAAPVGLAGALMAYIAYQGGSVGLGLIAYVMLGALYSAYSQARAYKAWQREWESLSPDGPRRGTPWYTWLGAIALASAILSVLFVDSATRQWMFWGVGFAALGYGLLVALSYLWGGLRRRRRVRAGSFTVRIVARPVMPVPSLDEAYRALPPHCQALLGGQK